MQAYIIRRLLLVVPTLLLVTIIVFFLMRSIPGNVVDLMLVEQEYGAQVDRDALLRKLGFDRPMVVQYRDWIFSMFRGDFGKSLWSNRSVLSEIKSRLPVSVELGILSILIGQLIALPVGIYSAIRQDTVGDYVGRSIAIGFLCVPSFWLGILIMVFPSIWWGWSPPVQYVPFNEDPLANLSMFIIPATVLGLASSGVAMRMTRTMMLEVLRQDYIRTAWAKGLRERVVVARHALKNALIPVITIVGMGIPVLIGGTVIIEKIFALPGMGRMLLGALSTRDYTLLSGVNLFVALFVLLNNLAVDLSYAWLDPRIRYK